jgi:type II secretory pathway component PulF
LAQLLGLSLEAGLTLDRAITDALELDVNACYRQRIRRWLKRVLAGENVSQAALRCGVGRPIAWALANDAGTDALTMLRTVERLQRLQTDYWANVGRVVFTPLVVFVLALCVGIVAYALFAPISNLIRATTASLMP